jgi:hypothetical protein
VNNFTEHDRQVILIALDNYSENCVAFSHEAVKGVYQKVLDWQASDDGDGEAGQDYDQSTILVHS